MEGTERQASVTDAVMALLSDDNLPLTSTPAETYIIIVCASVPFFVFCESSLSLKKFCC